MTERQRYLVLLREASLAVVNDSRGVIDGEMSPLDGCCGAVALMLHGCFGGCILKGKVNGTDHYWNRLGDGQEVDLTSCQFGGDGFSPVAQGEPIQTPELLDPEYMLFGMAVLERIGSYRGPNWTRNTENSK